jgi:hypothetical protein
VTGVPSAVRSRIGTGVPSSRVWTTPSVDESGATVATATSTCLVFDLPS